MLLGSSCSALTVTQLIERHRASVGSTIALRSYERLSWEGTLTLGERRMPVKSVRRAPEFLRREVQLKHWSLIEVFDGETGWQWFETGAERTEMTRLVGSALQELAGQAQFFPEWWDEPQALEQVGVSDVMIHRRLDAPVFRLRWVSADGFDESAYFNAYNFRLLMTEKRPEGSQGAPLRTFFSNFRTVGDLTLPTRIATFHGDEPVGILEIATLDLDPVVIRSLFQPPVVAATE
ncbi:MAG: hypothetical protein ACFB21_12385 [Opitutales bacterium]